MTSKRSLIIGSLAGIVLIVSIMFIWRSARRPPATTRTWFYDLNTDQLFPAPLGAVPPIAAPSGPQADGAPAGVRAYVLGCGGCDASQRFIAYLESYTEEARTRLDRAHETDPTEVVLSQYDESAGILVRQPTAGEWVERSSPAGQQVLADGTANRCPAGVFPQQCYPGQ
ncbi:hypothetical protein HQ590_00080 [bacterium]|nr:hypothetical protein [bacterium]